MQSENATITATGIEEGEEETEEEEGVAEKIEVNPLNQTKTIFFLDVHVTLFCVRAVAKQPNRGERRRVPIRSPAKGFFLGTSSVRNNYFSALLLPLLLHLQAKADPRHPTVPQD